jgi:hypothetical protein
VSDRPPFDPIRACFYLIAAILAFQCLVALLALFVCIYWSGSVIAGKASCENINGLLNQLMSGALAAALAFTAGFAKKDK